MSSPPGYTGDWITPDHPRYSEAIARWAANSERHAKAVAFVKSPADVVIVLRYAREYNLPIAIRGGGHSTAGASSIENGIVVDLSRHLSGVKVDPVAKLAYVGGGAIWETVDKAAAEHGLATVGGTVNHTGVGGLLLGGGYGFLTGQYGLALDNLVQATVVTARGEILTASSTENAELFWGIRGAGCNFGVVTEFVLQLHTQRRTVFAGIIAFPQPEIPKAVLELVNSWEAGLSEQEAIFYAQTTDPAGKPLALFILFWNGSEEEGRAHFKTFFDLGPVMDTCKEIPYEELNSMQNFNVKHGKNYYMKGVFASAPQADVAHNLVSRLPELSTKNDIRLTVVYELISTKKVLSIPNHATAHIRGSRVNVLIFATWDDKDTKKLDTVRSAANELGGILLEGERNIPESLNTGYGNYNSEEIVSSVGTSGSKVSAEALFSENYAKLQKLKKQYDPDLVFFKWCPITPEA
ncbi:FAD-binding domain-containing protein [Multifurca ochricompacta]|uniref:FAD-binding domain-containing protein n=1 Tax=Multifurca ochricompacta TaxID=376703 RepID=A0AAD4M5S3_9AGAM|nr:FAD-binding domain-containing protein [Multifurca ochricompacta]